MCKTRHYMRCNPKLCSSCKLYVMLTVVLKHNMWWENFLESCSSLRLPVFNISWVSIYLPNTRCMIIQELIKSFPCTTISRKLHKNAVYDPFAWTGFFLLNSNSDNSCVWLFRQNPNFYLVCYVFHALKSCLIRTALSVNSRFLGPWRRLHRRLLGRQQVSLAVVPSFRASVSHSWGMLVRFSIIPCCEPRRQC